jgi:hypothetical protein
MTWGNCEGFRAHKIYSGGNVVYHNIPIKVVIHFVSVFVVAIAGLSFAGSRDEKDWKKK